MKRSSPTPQALSFSPAPFRSSRLAIPPSPISPRSPLSPLRFPTITVTIPTAQSAPLTLPPPPPNALKWLWQCHLCSRVYALGTTRRCLDDGHHFCAGTPVWKRDRKTGQRKCKKSRACASEFDYAGWKVWGEWTRECGEQKNVAALLRGEALESQGKGEPEGEKDCWKTCDYPSACRWGNQYGASSSTQQAPAAIPEPGKTFEALLSLSGAGAVPIMADVPPVADPASPQETRKPSLEDVVSSAQRRRRLSAGAPASPLASPPLAGGESQLGPLIAHAKNAPRVNEEGDVEMATADSALDESKGSSAYALQRAFDDFELDVWKGLGRAGELWNEFVTGGRRNGGQ